MIMHQLIITALHEILYSANKTGLLIADLVILMKY